MPVKSPNQTDLDSLLATAEAAARAGAAELVAWQGRFTVREKSPADLVTDADLASQQAIERLIAERFPDHQFVGEEQLAPTQVDPDRYCWVVDPLDGTTNYAHGFPAYAVSVAAVIAGDPVAGVIYNPRSEECFRARRSGGAWCNGERLSVSRIAALRDALVAASLPPQVAPDSPDLRTFCAVTERCQGIRRTGSCAMNLAHLSAGKLDAFWAHETNAWDVAAGVLLVREAGGGVTGVDGSAFDLWQAHFAATSQPALHPELLRYLRP